MCSLPLPPLSLLSDHLRRRHGSPRQPAARCVRARASGTGVAAAAGGGTGHVRGVRLPQRQAVPLPRRQQLHLPGRQQHLPLELTWQGGGGGLAGDPGVSVPLANSKGSLVGHTHRQVQATLPPWVKFGSGHTLYRKLLAMVFSLVRLSDRAAGQ